MQVSVPPESTRFLSTYQSFDGLAVGAGAVWVAGDSFGRTLWRISPSSRRVTAIPLTFVPGQIAAGEGAVWVTALLDDTVSRIDPTTNRVTANHPRRARNRRHRGRRRCRLGREFVRRHGFAHRSENGPCGCEDHAHVCSAADRHGRRQRLGHIRQASRSGAEEHDRDRRALGSAEACMDLTTTTRWRHPSSHCSSEAASARGR